MARKKKPNDYGTGIPLHEVEALARVLLPEIQAFLRARKGRGVCRVESTAERGTKGIGMAQGGNIFNDIPPLFFVIACFIV